MRVLAILVLVSVPAMAQDAPVQKKAPAAAQVAAATRMPPGATAFLEVRGLAGKVQAMLESPLGREILEHEAVKAFRASDEGRKLAVADAFVRGINGKGLLGVLDALAARDIAVGVYGAPQRVLAVARVDAVAVKQLLASLTLFARNQMRTVEPESENAAALLAFGPLHYCIDGDLLIASPVEELARQARERNRRSSVLGQERLALARTQADGADAFAFVDLDVYGKFLKQGSGKPDDLGQALILGAFAYYVPEAPWAGLGIHLDAVDRDWKLRIDASAPAPEKRAQPVEDAFCGTMPALPFRTPKNTLGVVRMRRSLQDLWANREALIADVGIPKLIEFESNFSNITYMSFVEDFLPNVGAEIALIGTRKVWKDGEAAPAVRFPQGAIVWPLKPGRKWGPKLQLTFNQFVSIINFQQGQMGGDPLLASSEKYKGVLIHTSKYHREVSEGPVPVTMNFTPSVAIVNDHLVIASTLGIVRELVDAQDGASPQFGGVNAGIWLDPAEIRHALVENRETLVAQSMLEDGSSRAAAEKKIDGLLGLARYLHKMRLTTKAADGKLGLSFELGLRATGATRGGK